MMMSEDIQFHQSLQLDPSWLRQSDTPYPASPYPGSPGPRSRVSHVTNPSWVSNSFQIPYSYLGPPSTPRPLPVPSPAITARATSEVHQVASESVPEQASGSVPEPTPESLALEGESEPQAEQEWGTEPTEHMDLSPQAFIETEAPLAPPIWSQESPKPKKRTMDFVGGFVTGLRKLPKAISRNHLRERKTPRKGPVDTLGPADASTPLPRYEDPGQPVPGPSNVHYVEAMEMPMEHPSQQLSYVDAEHFQDSPLHNPHDHADGETTVGHQDNLHPPASVSSPVPVDPLPTADYAKMESPVRVSPPDDSISAHITRVRKFITELRELPWFSIPVTSEYFPAESSRARDPKTKSVSWYSTRSHEPIDLLASRPELHQREYERQPTHTRTHSASMSPVSPAHARLRRHTASILSGRMTSGGVTSPGASSHGQGQHSYFSYLSAGQPLYVLPPVIPSPQSNLRSDGVFGRPETGQPMMGYFVPAQSPILVPSPPPPSHPPTHIQFPTASQPPSNAADTNLSR
ncbi:hypothetical protein AcV7_005090 [Taiwanofungus camphoratus]|nr:hypothetical protein AcV7_005090 [Antrodia cinnamomea]